MAKSPVSDPILAQILSPPSPPPPKKKIFVVFTSTRYYALLDAIIACNFKEN